MRILLVIEDVTIGGQQTYTYNILKHLDKEKHTIYTAFFRDGDFHHLFKQISAATYKIGAGIGDKKNAIKKPHSLPLAVAQLVRIIKKNKIDVVATNGSVTHLVGTLAAKLAGVKCVRFIGGDLVKNEKFFFVKHFNHIPLHKLTDLFFGYPHMLKLHQEKGVKEEKLIDICNATGVDIDHFKDYSPERRKELRAETGIEENKLVIGWVGRIYQGMEIIHTVRMLEVLLKKGFHDFVFLVVGDGPWMEDLKKIISEAGLEKYTKYMGWQPLNKIPDFLNCMDIVPLLDKDPHGGSIVREAMSCGRIVLTVDGESGMQALWIKNGETGFLVKPENMYEDAALICINLYQHPEERKRISENGRAYALAYMDFRNLTRIFEEATAKLF